MSAYEKLTESLHRFACRSIPINPVRQLQCLGHVQRNRVKVAEATKTEPQPDLIAPRTLPKPEGSADDLTRIKGIGPKLSSLLNELGIYHFRQIADWSDAEARWVDDYLSFKGRVAREQWIPQALSLMANGSATVH